MSHLAKQLVLLSLLMLSQRVLSQKNAMDFKNGQQGYLIMGTINGIESGTVRMLSSNGSNVLDSGIVVKGKFSMQGKICTPQRMLFNISPGNWNFQAFVEDTNIELYIDTTGTVHHGEGDEKWALIGKIDQTGSALADVYTKYEKETDKSHLVSVYSALRKKLKSVKGNADAESQLVHEMDSLKNLILARLKGWIENYISQNPSSVAGVYLFNEYYQTSDLFLSLDYLDSILGRFSGAARTSDYFKELAEIALRLKNTQAGSLAPDFTLLKRDKSRFTLSSTRGNYVLIDFWASWCVPCRKAIPIWKEVYAQYKNKGFVIVSVSNDRNWDDWIEALNKEQMPWIQVIDEFPAENEPALVAELYPSKGIPFYVLLDKEGKVILSSGDEDVMRKKVEEVFQ